MTPGPYRTQGSVARSFTSMRCADCSTTLDREVVCFSGEGNTLCQGCFRLECATAAANELRLPRVHPTWGAGRFIFSLLLGLAVIPGRAFLLFAFSAVLVWGVSRTIAAR